MHRGFVGRGVRWAFEVSEEPMGTKVARCAGLAARGKASGRRVQGWAEGVMGWFVGEAGAGGAGGGARKGHGVSVGDGEGMGSV